MILIVPAGSPVFTGAFGMRAPSESPGSPPEKDIPGRPDHRKGNEGVSSRIENLSRYMQVLIITHKTLGTLQILEIGPGA